MSQPFLGTTQLRLDMLHLKTTNMLEFDPLEQIPDPFLGIQFWSIARQAFEMNTFGSSFCQKVFDDLTAMNRGTVPNDQQFAGNLSQEQLQKANYIWAFVGMVLGLHVYLAFRGDGANGREMVAGQFDAQYGRLANWSIGASHQWQKIKSRLIYEDNSALFVFGLFFSSSHRCSFQLWIAASSRCVAFWMGFCWLYLMLRRRRLQ